MEERTVSTQRKLSAIMFTDLQGFSRSMGENEGVTLALVKRYGELVALNAQKHDGTIIKTIGDGFLIDFSSAVNAVRCAIDLQKDAREHNGGRSENEQMRIRIGIHIGDIVMVGDDIMGDAVNIASRIESFANAGDICISRDVYRQVEGKMDCPAIPLGSRELKNIEKSVELYLIPSGGLSRSPLRRRMNVWKKRWTGPVWKMRILAVLAVGAIIYAVSVERGFSPGGTKLDLAVQASKAFADALPGDEGKNYKQVIIQYVENGKVVAEKTERFSFDRLNEKKTQPEGKSDR